MTTKLIFYSICALTIICSCSKKNSDAQATTIDVSKQWNTDPTGYLISSAGDGQWQAKTFTAQELNLFSSMDTANLNGTSIPTTVLEVPPNYSSTYPNPFPNFNTLPLHFSNGFSGQIVLK